MLHNTRFSKGARALIDINTNAPKCQLQFAPRIARRIARHLTHPKLAQTLPRLNPDQCVAPHRCT